MNTTLVTCVSGGGRGALVLVILDPAAPRAVLLPEAGERTIGRGTVADIPVDDDEASRVHVRLRCTPPVGAGEPRLTLTDNESRNGTLVCGRRLAAGETVVLALGDTFQVGRTLLTVQREDQLPRPRRLYSHAFLVARLDEECARAADGPGARTVMLARLSLDPAKEDALWALVPSLLRPFDLLARRSPGELELLLCETAPAEAQALVATLVAVAGRSGIELRSTAASFPTDGRSAYALLDTAELRLRGSAGAAAATSVDGGELPEELLARVQRAASSPSTVLLLGETGTGKSYLAARLHALSPRAAGPFVVCDCAAISRELVESELFGHARGAFTGAVSARTGLIEAAQLGTLFLDEIGELPPEQQGKLLTVLESKQVRRVGETKARTVDFRLLASTNQDLRALVQQGRFRPELYYRLNVIRLTVPPLRERPATIAGLARRFVDEIGAAAGRPLRLAPDVLPLLRSYPWPGNIRELRHAIERAAATSAGDVLQPEDFELEDCLTVKAAPAAGVGLSPGPWQAGELSREQLMAALMAHGGNRTRTGKALGRSREWLRQKCIELGIPLGR